MSVLAVGSRNGSPRGLREKASEKLSAVGKSIWGYFSSSKERVRSGSGKRNRGGSDASASASSSASKQNED